MERREFIAVAGRTTAGVVLGGGAFLAACTNDAEESGPTVGPTTSPTTDATTATTTATSTSDTTAGSDGLVYRLSTRGSTAPCGACRAHAAHRYFVSAQAADAGRAHPGCDCTILTQPVPDERTQQWFVGGRDVFDDRWTG